MIAEIILGAMIAFSIGAYAGKEEGKREATKEQVILPEKQPDVWPPHNHEKLLKTCALMCGEEKLSSYNSIYGKCSCKD